MKTSAGMSSRMTHAPWLNLVTAKIIITTKVLTAPIALIARWKRQCGSCFSTVSSPFTSSPGCNLPIFRKRTTMPVWDMVKLRKTPMA